MAPTINPRPKLVRIAALVIRGTAALFGAVLVLAAPPATAATGDPSAIALAESTLDAMGGSDAWERLRYLRWRFFGKRLHHWDRSTGDVRIESDGRVVLMNLRTKQGRVWEGGVEITDEATRREALDLGHAWWVNDSYWLIMPVKLLDPGVILRDGGEDELPDGRAARRLTVTFEEGTGLTPQNRYDVWIDAETQRVEQWAFYRDAADAEPAFVLPWSGWKPFGEVLIATEHGRGADWEIAAPDHLPEALFERP